MINTKFSALSSSLAGIQRNLKGLTADAHRSTSATNPLELVEPLVSSLEHQRSLEASVYALRSVDDALGTLLDTFA